MVDQPQEHRVVMLVEEALASRAAAEWAACNLLRTRDAVTLLYIARPSRSKKRQRALRLKGFHLALSFKELCSSIPEVKIEIVVKEGDQVAVIASLTNEIGAAVLVVGLHEQSCLYRMTAENPDSKNLCCRILAVKQQQQRECKGFVTIEFTQVELARFCIRTPKIRYQILPSCPWRTRRNRRKERNPNEVYFLSA